MRSQANSHLSLAEGIKSPSPHTSARHTCGQNAPRARASPQAKRCKCCQAGVRAERSETEGHAPQRCLPQHDPLHLSVLSVKWGESPRTAAETNPSQYLAWPLGDSAHTALITTGTPHFIVLHSIVGHGFLCVFSRVEGFGNLASSKSLSTTFPTAPAHSVSLSHILAILTEFQFFIPM